MRLVLTLGGGSLEFTPLNDSGAYPLLHSVGTIRVVARAGSTSTFGSNESPSASVKLKNQGGEAAALIGYPLRALAQIFDDAGALAFTGFVAGITFGALLELRLES